MSPSLIPPPSSPQALRAALIGHEGPGHPDPEVTGHAARSAVHRTTPPTAAELLDASPNLQRLCEGYHRTQRHLVARNRRQRLGLALLVAAVGVAAAMLADGHHVSVGMASDLVLAVGLASGLAVGLLALLWLRDDRRLRRAQGDRLLRALQFNCALPPDRIEALRNSSHPTAVFFECYAWWRVQHPDQASGLAAVMRTLRGEGSVAA
jgi:hypothetical protein